MEIVHDWPPNIDLIRKNFSIGGQIVHFSYGDTIYNPSGVHIPKDYILHEEVHCKQQKDRGGPENWWELYVLDPEFRVQQEIEAYGAQLKYIRATHGHAKAQSFLTHASKALSGPTYGSAISRKEAHRMIMQESL